MSNKLSYASGASDRPLLGNTIGQVFDNIANKFPEKVKEIKKIAEDPLKSFEPPKSLLDFRTSDSF